MSLPPEVVEAVRRAAEPPPVETTRELMAPFLRAVAGVVENVGATLPSPAGLAAATRGGTTIYERDGAA